MGKPQILKASQLLCLDFVAWQLIAFCVVSPHTVWPCNSCEWIVAVFVDVVNQVLDIRVSKVASETALLILYLSAGQSILVVSNWFIEEPFIEDSLKEDLEVAHKPGIVAILIFWEDT